MKRKDGHFDCKGKKDEPEKPGLRVCRYQEMCAIKRAQRKGMFFCVKINIDEAYEHHQGSEESINKEFKCGCNASFPAPLGSKEINRYQRQLPEKIKQQSIRRQKHTQ